MTKIESVRNQEVPMTDRFIAVTEYENDNSETWLSAGAIVALTAEVDHTFVLLATGVSIKATETVDELLHALTVTPGSRGSEQ